MPQVVNVDFLQQERAHLLSAVLRGVLRLHLGTVGQIARINAVWALENKLFGSLTWEITKSKLLSHPCVGAVEHKR